MLNLYHHLAADACVYNWLSAEVCQAATWLRLHLETHMAFGGLLAVKDSDKVPGFFDAVFADASRLIPARQLDSYGCREQAYTFTDSSGTLYEYDFTHLCSKMMGYSTNDTSGHFYSFVRDLPGRL